nr:unnamed protein product [Callosobruchus chinensis]
MEVLSSIIVLPYLAQVYLM